jgi:hypothetical protein
MLCWLKNGEVVDCWGNKYDLSDVVVLELGKKKFDIQEEIKVEEKGEAE